MGHFCYHRHSQITVELISHDEYELVNQMSTASLYNNKTTLVLMYSKMCAGDNIRPFIYNHTSSAEGRRCINDNFISKIKITINRLLFLQKMKQEIIKITNTMECF